MSDWTVLIVRQVKWWVSGGADVEKLDEMKIDQENEMHRTYWQLSKIVDS